MFGRLLFHVFAHFACTLELSFDAATRKLASEAYRDKMKGNH